MSAETGPCNDSTSLCSNLLMSIAVTLAFIVAAFTVLDIAQGDLTWMGAASGCLALTTLDLVYRAVP